MPPVSDPKSRAIAKPLVLSLIGVALVSPVPLLAGAPALTPVWLLQRVVGVPLLSIALLALMAGLVAVALLCLTKISGQDG